MIKSFMSLGQPLVSVVIPAYNHEKYISQALTSIIEQSYENLEIIVIDDGSSDATAEIAYSVLRHSSRPYRQEIQKNLGAHCALNRGIALAQGRYIAILNSDDFFDHQRIAKLMASINQTKESFAYSLVEFVDRNNTSLPINNEALQLYLQACHEATLFPTKSFELLRYNLAVSTGNFFFSHSLFDKLKGFRKFAICHDWDFILRALLFVEPICVPEVLLSYRLHGENTIIKKNTDNLGWREAKIIINNFLASSGQADNPLAPSEKNWGSYWKFFTDNYGIAPQALAA